VFVGKRYKVDIARINNQMEKVKRFKGPIITVVAALIIFLIFAGIYWQSSPRMLYPEEVREYQGQDLSSIADFRENSIKGPQYVNASTYRLKITGVVNQTLEYTYDEVINGFQKYQKVVTLNCVEGWSVKILWEGFLLKDLLNEAGIDPNATVVIFRAYDGYSTSDPLDYLLNNDILIAYKMNGLALPPERGFPFQLVAESKYGYKWIKWITSIEVSNDTNFRGYWESRGFPNDANLP
jgi:DMSO/TMAO reductase YedYZ molybdopterin-dependent catalytic subunit